GRTRSKVISERSIRNVIEVTGLHVEIPRLEIAVGRGQRIRAVICQHDRLRVLQFGEGLRLEHVIELKAVRLGGAYGRTMRGRPSGQQTDARILPRLGQRVARLEPFSLPAQVGGDSRAEVV